MSAKPKLSEISFKRGHLLEAISKLNSGKAHNFGKSNTYDVIHENQTYPPKAVVGLAAEIATGHEYFPVDFDGGKSTTCMKILTKFDFRWERKDGGSKFVPGFVYRRKVDIHAKYGGQEQGGISTPRSNPYIFLFTGESGAAHGYEDGWSKDGSFKYTGEGQRGDMKMEGGNLAIHDHLKDGKKLLLFAAHSKAHVRLIGEFHCIGYSVTKKPDTEGILRDAFVFDLSPCNTKSDHFDSDPVDTKTDLETLRERAIDAGSEQSRANTKVTTVEYRKRAKQVRDYVIRRSRGFCESCKSKAPFDKADGTPYLEAHHTKMISEDGPDLPIWVGAVCPNCHREIHSGQHGQKKNADLIKYIHSIEPQTSG